MIKELLEDFGYETDRFDIGWCSAAEPDKFVELVTDMTKRIKALGPHQNSLVKAEAA